MKNEYTNVSFYTRSNKRKGGIDDDNDDDDDDSDEPQSRLVRIRDGKFFIFFLLKFIFEENSFKDQCIQNIVVHVNYFAHHDAHIVLYVNDVLM